MWPGLRLDDRHGPDLFLAVAAAVGPGGEELAGVDREAVVVAVLVAGVGAGDRLVGLAGGDLGRRRSRWRRRRPRSGSRRRSSCGRRRRPCRSRSAPMRPVGLVDGQPLVELVVERRLVVDHHRRAPGGAAVGGAGEPDARLAGRGDVGAGLVGGGGAAGGAGEVGPRGVDVVRRRRSGRRRRRRRSGRGGWRTTARRCRSCRCVVAIFTGVP